MFVWPLSKDDREHSKEEIEFIETVVLQPGTEGPAQVPFPMFRVATQIGLDLWWRVGKLAFTCLRYLAPETPWRPDSKNELLMEHEYWWMGAGPGAQGGKPLGERLEGQMAVWDDWHRVDGESVKARYNEDQKAFKQVFLDPLQTLQGFLFDIEYPGNVVLKVGPAEKPGKSVEWRKLPPPSFARFLSGRRPLRRLCPGGNGFSGARQTFRLWSLPRQTKLAPT